MRRTRFLVAALAWLTSCGLGGTAPKSFVGTWSFTFKVADAMNGASHDEVVQILVETSTVPGQVALVLGNCEVPLRVQDHLAALGPFFTCPLAAGAPLPMRSGLAVSGEVLAVSKAELTLGADDHLSMALFYQVQTDPRDPTAGPTFEIKAPSPPGGSRAR